VNRDFRKNTGALDIKKLFMLSLLGLTVVHVRMNFVMNVEIIHTLQFGILAVLIFPLTRSFGATLSYTVLLGMVDEWYQYAVLYPEKSDYYDFNDVVLDQLGAAVSLVYLYSTGVAPEHKTESEKWYKSGVFISAALIASVSALLFHFSFISVYANNSKAMVVLNEAAGPEEFWRHLPNSDIVYHVMSPAEGMTMIVVLCGLLFLLDFLALRAERPLRGGMTENRRDAGRHRAEPTSASASPALP
jgi:hypothetical protein